MIAVGGEKGAKSFFSLIFNFIALFILLWLITLGFDPIKAMVFGCIIISSITLFYINGVNKKTVSSLFAVIVVVLITMLLTYRIGVNAKIQGVSKEQVESVTYLSPYVPLDFSKVIICVVLTGLLGAIIDVSISISSSMNEIFKNNPAIAKSSLFKSGINIGKDILGTMTNTLLFAYIGGFMTLILWFNRLNYSIANIVNAKIFCSEIFQILSSGIGIILIIPATAIITSMVLFFKGPSGKEKFKAKA